MYGRQIPSIAQQLGVTTKEAQKIYDSVLSNFPQLKQFISASEDMAREYGYVTTIWGRRRQLPNMQLPYFEFEYKDGVSKDFDPLSDSDDEVSTEVPLDIIRKYTNKLLNCNYKQKQRIFEDLSNQGIIVKDNSMKVSDAQRQCVNARVQGRRSTNCPYTLNSITQRCA